MGLKDFPSRRIEIVEETKKKKKREEVWKLCRNETDWITENCETVSHRVAAVCQTMKRGSKLQVENHGDINFSSNQLNLRTSIVRINWKNYHEIMRQIIFKYVIFAS